MIFVHLSTKVASGDFGYVHGILVFNLPLFLATGMGPNFQFFLAFICNICLCVFLKIFLVVYLCKVFLSS